MKKVLILGIGAQSSVIADLLNRKKDVVEIICADRNLPAAEELSSRLLKANAVGIDIMNYDEILRVGWDADFIVSGMASGCNTAAKEAARELNAVFV
jgi:saccharopine dehydrogenase-like NADP-dependent oxidoreductase